MGIRRSLATVVAGMTICAVVGACSSSSDDGDSSSGAPGTTSGSGANKATGTPIKFMAVLDELTNGTVSLPQVRAGMKAGLARVNSNGGLGGSGHPVEVEFCSTQLDPNQANSCVRKATSDSSIVGFLGSLVAEPVDSLIEKAGMATIGTIPVIDSQYTNKNLFSLVGGAVAASGGQANMMSQILKKKNISAGVLGIPAAVSAVGLMDKVLKSCGASDVNRTVQVPLSATDVSSYVASMTEKSDGIITATSPAQAQQFLVALKRAGKSQPLTLVNSQLNPPTIKSLGQSVEGTPIVSYFPASDSDAQGNKNYLSDMNAAGENDNLNDNAENAWLSVQLLNYSLKGATTFTRSSVLAAMNKSKGFTGDGLLPSLDFTKAGPLAAYPRLVNVTFYPGIVKNGKIVADGPKTAQSVFCS